MNQYTCCVCNKQFNADRKSAICPECKSKPSVCVICGNEFKRTFPYTQKTCSPKCRGEYRAQTGIAKAGAAKMRATKIDRYGSTDPNVVAIAKNGSLKPRICPLCNIEFTPKAVRQIYCGNPHFAPCPVCGKPTEIKDYNIGVQACSEECRMARINATCLEKYGNKDAVNSDHAKALAKQHCLERYGTEYYMQTDEAKARVKQTMLEKYGVEYALQSDEIKERVKATTLQRYGSENYLKTDEGKQKVKDTHTQRYGGIGLASPILKSKAIATNLDKYGTEWGFGSEVVRAKTLETLKKRYKVDNFKQTKEGIENVVVDPSRINQYMEFRADPVAYISKYHPDSKPTVRSLCTELGVSDTPIYDILIRHDCKDIVDRSKVSNMEQQMYTFLDSLNLDTPIVVNDRKQISPQELDFYLPEYNFAIECNPTSTHNSSMNSWGDDNDIKSYNYHQIKSSLAKEKGIFLMHVFGYEWINKRNIIESMIRNVLGKCSGKVFARNTKVVEVDAESASRFLNSNHRQGNCYSSIRLGLVDKNSNELVSLMTFGKMRTSIGKKDEESNSSTFELVRFCSKLNTSVVGGASKLFKYFLSQYSPDKVVSFSDVAHTKGTLYDKLGFSEITVSSPGYVWVRFSDELYKNRVSCQKQFLPKMFEDVSEEDIANKTEPQIMMEHGYVQVFDSGVIRWEWSK